MTELLRETWPLISINIPTYNSGKTLRSCLESVVQSGYPNLDVVLIDSYSTDDTVKIASEYGCRILFANTLSEARRKGALASEGEYVLHVDSDQIIDKDTLFRCVLDCEKLGVDALILLEIPMVPERNLFARIIAYDKYLANVDKDPYLGSAMPRFFRKEVLVKAKWPGNLVMLDHSFIYLSLIKAGAKVGRTMARIYHLEPASLGQIARKFYRYGKYYCNALRANSRLTLTHSLPRRSYFRNLRRIPRLIFLGLLFLYFIKALSVSLGILSSIIEGRVSTTRLPTSK